MKQNIALLFLSVILFTNGINAQKSNTDSLQVAKTLSELLTICRSVDFADPKVTLMGTFYKAAPYIIYRGDDKDRNWKDFADYSKAGEKTGVDNVCELLNRTANQDSAYKIIQYITEKESEGTWHILMVTYKKKGVEKKTTYAFLKIGNKFGLGDID
jgi:hypothetical protein